MGRSVSTLEAITGGGLCPEACVRPDPGEEARVSRLTTATGGETSGEKMQADQRVP